MATGPGTISMIVDPMSELMTWPGYLFFWSVLRSSRRGGCTHIRPRSKSKTAVFTPGPPLLAWSQHSQPSAARQAHSPVSRSHEVPQQP